MLVAADAKSLGTANWIERRGTDSFAVAVRLAFDFRPRNFTLFICEAIISVFGVVAVLTSDSRIPRPVGFREFGNRVVTIFQEPGDGEVDVVIHIEPRYFPAVDSTGPGKPLDLRCSYCWAFDSVSLSNDGIAAAWVWLDKASRVVFAVFGVK